MGQVINIALQNCLLPLKGIFKEGTCQGTNFIFVVVLAFWKRKTLNKLSYWEYFVVAQNNFVESKKLQICRWHESGSSDFDDVWRSVLTQVFTTSCFSFFNGKSKILLPTVISNTLIVRETRFGMNDPAQPDWYHSLTEGRLVAAAFCSSATFIIK